MATAVERALVDLRKRGHLFLTGRGRHRAQGTLHPPYSRKTLQTLVDQGHAEWGSLATWPKIVLKR